MLRWEPIEADAWVVKRSLVVALVVIALLTGCGSSRATHRTVRYAPTRGDKVTTTDPRGDTFSITRDPDGSIIRTCHPAGIPGCSSAGTWWDLRASREEMLRDGTFACSSTLRRTRRLGNEMFVLLFIAWPALEIFVFIEVGHAVGWLLAVVLLLGTSVLGAQLLRIQGRAAIERVSLAVSEHRTPARAAIDGLLGFLGGVLLVIPGFVTDVLGALLVLPPTKALTRRWLSRHYSGRIMRFVATSGRFASRDRGWRPDDVESTAVDDDLPRLDR